MTPPRPRGVKLEELTTTVATLSNLASGITVTTAGLVIVTHTNVQAALADLDAQVNTNKSNITTNTAAIATKVASTRSVATSTGLTGGGDLSADRTLSLATIATGNVMANLSGSTAAPIANTLPAIKTALAITASDVNAAPTTRNVATSTGLTGGGDLSADRTLSLATIVDQRIMANLSGSTAAPTANTLPAIKTALAITAADVSAAPTSRQVATSTGLTGGGDLSADRTLSLATIADGNVLGNTSGSTAAPTAQKVGRPLLSIYPPRTPTTTSRWIIASTISGLAAAAPVVNVMGGVVFFVSDDTTIKAIASEITIVASGGTCLIYPIFYSATADGDAGNVFYDPVAAGTMSAWDGTSGGGVAGVRSTTLSATKLFPAGMYYGGVVWQGTATTGPTMRCSNGTTSAIATFAAGTGAGFPRSGFQRASVSGTRPSPAGFTTDIVNTPVLWLQCN